MGQGDFLNNLKFFPAGLRPKFSLPLLDDLIINRGVDICWRKSVICACITPQSGQPDSSCTECRGFGFTWDTGETFRALVTSRTWNTVQAPIPHGFYDQGTVNVTFPRGKIPASNDSIIVVNDIVVFTNEVLIKGETAPNGQSLERVLASEPIEIERIIVTRRTPSTGHPYTTSVKDFYQGTNFDLSDKNRIVWTGTAPAGAPNTGELYSVRYKARPEYVVYDSNPLFRVDGSDVLPTFVRAKRIDFIRREATNG